MHNVNVLLINTFEIYVFKFVKPSRVYILTTTTYLGFRIHYCRRLFLYISLMFQHMSILHWVKTLLNYMWKLNFDTSKDEIELPLGIRSFTKWIKLTFWGHFAWVPSPIHVSKSHHGGKVSTFESQKTIIIGLIIIELVTYYFNQKTRVTCHNNVQPCGSFH